MNLISLDGYNPLVINGSTFTLKNTIDKEYLSKEILGEVNNKFIDLLSSEFTPGGLINFFVKQNLKPLKTDEEIFKLVLNNSEEHLQAVFGEGYWIDHFTYNLDLIESYLWLYPEKEKELLFVDNSYRYFYNPVYVLPRSEKIGKTNKGTIRQYGSTNEISKALNRGKHTTRHVELINLLDGWVADTPGFGIMDFIDMDEVDVSHSFVELFNISNNCKYNGCLHLNEPKCAVKEAVKNGEILDSRYENYKQFVEEIKNRKKW